MSLCHLPFTAFFDGTCHFCWNFDATSDVPICIFAPSFQLVRSGTTAGEDRCVILRPSVTVLTGGCE